MNDQPVDLAAQLVEAVKASGLSLNQVAKRAGIQYSALWRIVHGEARDPNVSTASKLCTLLGLELRPVQRGKGKKASR